jgi:hypothetical protein
MTWAFSENAKLVRRIVYQQFLAVGVCHGTTSLLKETGLPPETLRESIAELQRGLMVMCVPGTDEVAKCPPWSNVPTRHGIEKDGKHICHAGCMLEAMNASYCYPGEIITIRSSCPETGREIVIRLRGNELLEASPSSVVGHVGVDPSRWSGNWFYGCAHNNFFASPDAVAAWESAYPKHQGVTLTMDQLKLFARYENRLDYERGADPDSPGRSGDMMFGKLGVTIPAHWR